MANVWSFAMNSFDPLTSILIGLPEKPKITADNYLEWQKQWVFDAIGGKRLGQSFCLYFRIPNATPLYHFKDNNLSERWINDNYLK